MDKSLQDTYAADSICFGCGPANLEGLQIKSFVQRSSVIAQFTPCIHQQAFPGVLCGGIIGTALDCHCNWTACWFLMQENNLTTAPSTVTAEYTIKLLKPTPMDKTLTLIASIENIAANKATVVGKLTSNQQVYATCRGIFVIVQEGHPAYHRW